MNLPERRHGTEEPDQPGRLGSGVAFLDRCSQLFAREGVTREALDVLFAGFRMLNACLSPEEWAAFLELCDEHPVNAYLFPAPGLGTPGIARAQGAASARVTAFGRSGRAQRRRMGGYR